MGFWGALAAGEIKARDKRRAEEQQAIENNFKNALITAQMAHLQAETDHLTNPVVNWQTRTAPDGTPYQVQPQTGESRPVQGVQITPRPARKKNPIIKADEQGFVWAINPDDPTDVKPVPSKKGGQLRTRIPASKTQRTVGVAPAPIRTVEKQISDTREDIKRNTPKPLGPLSTSADSASFRSKNQGLRPLTQRLDSLSSVRDRMAGEQQGKTAAPVDPTAGMKDEDAWEYWVAHGITPSEATAKVNARSKR